MLGSVQVQLFQRRVARFFLGCDEKWAFPVCAVVHDDGLQVVVCKVGRALFRGLEDGAPNNLLKGGILLLVRFGLNVIAIFVLFVPFDVFVVFLPLGVGLVEFGAHLAVQFFDQRVALLSPLFSDFGSRALPGVSPKV